MRYEKKMNRYERAAFQKKKMDMNLGGQGIYLYQNNCAAGLMLPKADLQGSRNVGPWMTFKGDNYFMSMVRNNELKLIEEIEAPKPKENAMNNNVLILDQPPTVTEKGTVEHHVVETPGKHPLPKLTEKSHSPSQEVLLLEDPLSGVSILD